MLKKYLLVFFVSMVPLIELRGAIPYSQLPRVSLPLLQAYIVAVIGNMVPVPFIYLFARRVLEWGTDKPVIGKFFRFCQEEDFLWHCFYLSVFRCRAQAHGQEHSLPAFWIWILNPVLQRSCLAWS